MENLLSSALQWPEWALKTVVLLTGIIVVIFIIQFFVVSSVEAVSAPKKSVEFRWFQFQYLSVFLIIMLADWLQGTNMYTLYASYGVDIGTLFLTGFFSSAVFGTFVGMLVDEWGRKFGCVIFCLLEIVINVLEHIPNMSLLLLGRIMGGVSTSLLFSSFECWMVSEHRKRGFPEAWLTSTFSISSWGNGIIAICAGFVAQLSADIAGDIGPFQLAIVLTVLTLCLIYPWRENYGETSYATASPDKDGKAEITEKHTGLQAIVHSFQTSIHIVKNSTVITCLGLSQACFEGAMYTFVFMWVPSLLAVSGGGALPTGLIFSCFMLSMTIGGMLFGLLESVFPGGPEYLCIFVYLVAAVAMAVPLFFFDFTSLFISFLVLEAMVGMFYSCGATLRSRYYPEQHQSSIMSVFRVPLNLLVVVGTKLTSNANNAESLQLVFGAVVVMHLTAMMLQTCLLSAVKEKKRQEFRELQKSKQFRSTQPAKDVTGHSTTVKSTSVETLHKRK